MRAVAIDTYGQPDVLQLRDVPEPKLGPDSVLVRVAAASINPVDYKIVQGYLDGAFPVLWPLVPGWDVAGEVVAAGPAVRDVRGGESTVTKTVTVRAQDTAGGALPNTGADVTGLAATGALVLAAGAAGAVATRRRRSGAEA